MRMILAITVKPLAPWWHKRLCVFRSLLGLCYIGPHTHTPVENCRDSQSKERRRRSVKLSSDHNKPEQGARLTFEVGFRRGFSLLILFSPAGCLINFHCRVGIRYFDRTQQLFKRMVGFDHWMALCLRAPALRWHMATIQAATGEPRGDILNNALWEFWTHG